MRAAHLSAWKQLQEKIQKKIQFRQHDLFDCNPANSGQAQASFLKQAMEWQIKTISRKSSRSGEPFAPGDVAVSLIYLDAAEGSVARADLHESELDEFELAGELLGRWRRVIQDPDEASAQASDTLTSAEDFFFSLFENESDEPAEERDMLKHLLALMLERKRVLRALGQRKGEDTLTYLHVKSKTEVIVPIRDMSRELMLKIEDTLGDIVF